MYVRVKNKEKIYGTSRKKYVVQADSKISDIYSKLNSVQKQTVSLFDKDRNGVLDRDEAKAFNSTVFSDKGDSVDCWIQLSSGKKQKVSVKKDAIDTSALSLSLKKTGKKKVGNKIYRYQEERLSKENCESTKEALQARFRESSRGYEYDSQDSDGNKKYVSELDKKEYIILDKFAGTVEESRAIYDGDRLCGYNVESGKTIKYYDTNNKLLGSSERTRVVGCCLYKDANGKPMYMEEALGEGGFRYYDVDGKLLYTVQYWGDGECEVEICNNEGIVVAKKQVKDFTKNEPFQELRGINKNPIQNGKLEIYKK